MVLEMFESQLKRQNFKLCDKMQPIIDQRVPLTSFAESMFAWYCPQDIFLMGQRLVLLYTSLI